MGGRSYGLLRGRQIHDTGAFANACAAICCTRVGARSMVTLRRSLQPRTRPTPGQSRCLLVRFSRGAACVRTASPSSMCQPKNATKSRRPSPLSQRGPGFDHCCGASRKNHCWKFVWFSHCRRCTDEVTSVGAGPVVVTVVDGNHGGENPLLANRRSKNTFRFEELMF